MSFHPSDPRGATEPSFSLILFLPFSLVISVTQCTSASCAEERVGIVGNGCTLGTKSHPSSLTQSRRRCLGQPAIPVHGDKPVYSAPLIQLGKYPFIGLPSMLSSIHRGIAAYMTPAKPPHPSLFQHKVPREGLLQGSSPRGGCGFSLHNYLSTLIIFFKNELGES